MKSYREELTFETKTRRAYINITPQVESALKKSGIKEGLCLVNPMHISASVYINDDEPGLLQDYDDFLERLVPHAPIEQYRHNDTGEDNADAHIKRQVMGREVVVAITNGKLDFGPFGSKSFMGSLMDAARSACSSRSSASSDRIRALLIWRTNAKEGNDDITVSGDDFCRYGFIRSSSAGAAGSRRRTRPWWSRRRSGSASR
jgi:secondary thiamine-phosphate synthase enzyme